MNNMTKRERARWRLGFELEQYLGSNFSWLMRSLMRGLFG